MEPTDHQQQYSCNDLSFTAYLLTKGATFLIAKQLGSTYQFTVFLNGLNINTMRMEFINSECAKFDQAVKNLKKIIFSGRSRPR